MVYEGNVHRVSEWKNMNDCEVKGRDLLTKQLRQKSFMDHRDKITDHFLGHKSDKISAV